MPELKLYRCTHCGNIVVKLHDSKVKVVCCGEPMQELVPNTVDAAQEKHVPVATPAGSSITITVGAVEHPMLEEHHIEFILLQTTAGWQVKYLAVGDKPQATFALAEGEKALAAFEYCNLHGLWTAAI